MRSSIIEFSKETSIALIVSTLCMLFAAIALGYGDVPLDVPTAYGGDGLSAGMLIKGILENGWYLDNPNAGAPFGLSWGPYPMVDSTHFLWIKLLAWFVDDYGTLLTTFYLTSFFTSSITAYAVMRCLGIGRALSASGALLFSLQNYHFLRGAHIFLSVYFSVPIFVGMAIMLHRHASASMTAGRIAVGIALLLLASGGGVYYSFFGCMLITVAAVVATIEQRRWRPLLLGAAMVLVICTGVFICLLPHLNHAATHSADTDISTREPQESEIFGLKLVQLVIPSPIHRSPSFRSVNASYSRNSPLVNENSAAGIGVIGSLGLFFSLLVLVIQRAQRSIIGLWELGTVNITAFLFATIGGAGTIFAWCVTPQIRGLNRISIVIAFISLCAILLVTQQVVRWGSRERWRSPTTLAAALALAIFGLWDQTPGWHPSIAAANQPAFSADVLVGQQIMEAFPRGSRVYQLPYVKFPESPPLYHEGVYGMSRWYLHTSAIAWSYGAMNLTESDQWQQYLESLPIELRLSTLAASGFDGVMVERRAYPDAGASVEVVLKKFAGAPVVVCPDSSCALYRLRAGAFPSATPALLAIRGNGWSDWETDGKGVVSARSIGYDPLRLILLNPAKHSVDATLGFSLESDQAISIDANIDGRLLSALSLESNRELAVAQTLRLEPGATSLLLEADTARSITSSILIRNLSLTQAPAGP